MPILATASTRVLIQGITGNTGRLFAERMLQHGTRVVGGVVPGRGGETVLGLPVFDTMSDAVSTTHGNAVLSCIHPSRVLDGLYEVVQSRIPLIIQYIENIPVHDAIRMRSYASAYGTRILGPNSAGAVSPGIANLSDLNDVHLRAGRIGIVSKSGTLTYEVIEELHAHGYGESSVVCLGGDRVVGTGYDEVLRLFDADDGTDLVVVIGEPGGGLEYAAADRGAIMSKPVVAYITGQMSPADTRMGHAGAIVGSDKKSLPSEKIGAFVKSGIPVARTVLDVGRLVAHSVAMGNSDSIIGSLK